MGSISFISLSLLLLFPHLAFSQVSSNFLKKEQPKFELGGGAIGLQTPLYPGARQNQFRIIPFPFIIYRGDFLRSDAEGTRARLNDAKTYEFGMSLGFNFPVRSKETNLRKGMDDLDSLIQVGPRLLLRFLPKNSNQRLNFTLGLRAAFSTDLYEKFQDEGFAIEPGLSFWSRWPETQVTFFSRLSFSFGSRKLNGFFYDVSPSDATAQRDPYHAKAGLTETSGSMGLSTDLTPTIMVFAAGSLRNYDWASNRKSPLIETRNNFSFITGFVWVFHQSEEKVKVDSIPIKR